MSYVLPRLALFDCDGTLVDSQHAFVTGIVATCQAAGVATPDLDAVRRMVLLAPTEVFARLLPGTDDWMIRRLAGLFRESFYRATQPASRPPDPLFPGLREVLAALRGHGFQLGIATGKSRQGLATMLEQHTLTGWFATLQTADRRVGKPDPDMVFHAQQETGCTAAGTVVIGDTTHDIEMAHAAGVRVIAVTWGYHAICDLEAAGADRIIDVAEQLVPAVLELTDATS
jgi:phosphoglycolate phosphatase